MEMLPMKAWYNHEHGVIELEDDVLSIVRQVRELYERRITIELLPDSREPYAFVEHCEDGADRLVFTCVELDGRALERLLRSDSHGRAYIDPYDESEQAHDRLQEEKDYASQEKLGEVAEEMAYALKREGRAESLPLTVGLNAGRTQRADDHR
jgi:hypothetical protein